MKNSQGVFATMFVFVLFCTACAARPHNEAGPHRESQANFDRAFLENRFHYYEEQSTITQLCLEKAQRSELRSFCYTLSNLQPDRSMALKNWLASWYAASPTTAASEEEHSAEYFQSIISEARSATGSEFENALLNGLRLHHHHGIDDLNSCVDKANHSELKQWCSTVLFEEKRETNQMTAWICSWFRDCLEKPLPE